ncbi:MAG: hypothetical protein KKI12_00310 [Proteobacteria bacterium]|nr:hypothetical protein [Pseudomonadota bacterium]MBU4259063.1 hypothetical protein [Pseudomonadota bacterium]MBU4286599.1 hypothetical protein [Pseudomonadota bacterium]MBU4414229.1 hypothetical protein [Pseudomonadota bacterium]MCG2758015.1 hypothetical protein [Desulfobacteraceae bacterium]
MHSQRQIDFEESRNNTRTSTPDVTHSGNIKKSSETAFLTELFQRLNDNNIHYCVLRNYESLPYSLNGSDLDLLIPKSELTTTWKIIQHSAKECGGKCINKYRVEAVITSFLGYYDNKWWGAHIDIFPSLEHRGIPYYNADKVIHSAKKHQNILVATDGHAHITAFIKEILANGKSRKDYKDEASRAYEKDSSLYHEILIRYFGLFVAKRWRDHLIKGNQSVPNLKRLCYEARFALICRALFRQPVNFFSKKIQLIYRRYIRLFCPPGAILAILGTDGSGKSTIIEGIRPPLESALHTKLNYEHMRPNLLPSIARLFGRQTKEGPVTNPHGSKSSGFFGSFLRLSYYSLDYVLGYWLKVYPAKVKRPCLYVFDRYFYDFITDPARSRISLPKWLIKLFAVLIPAPDLILCLGADPAVIHARKPELPLIEVERQMSELKKFCDSSPRAVWIDTAQSVEKSVNQALESITNHMAARYE